MLAFIFGIVLFVILALIAKAVFEFLFVILDVLLGKKKLTKKEIVNVFSFSVGLLGFFICLGGLFYFLNEEKGHLAWHILIYDVLFFYITDRFDENSKSTSGVFAWGIIYSYPFIWALYSGFAVTVYSIVNLIVASNF